LAVLTALGGCGQSTSNTAAAPSTSPAGPVELTDAQKKALIAELPAAYQGADLVNGEAKFAVCRACHTINQGGEDMTGPNLWGIFGRKAGSEPGFSYSDDLKNAGWTWDAGRIDTWIANPRAVLPNTKMTFAGLTDPTDRRDIVAFLKVQTSAAP
jgi:cytochrome c